MGQKGSSLMKKMASPFMGWGGSGDIPHNEQSMAVTPFVYSRQGSMFFDDEGDLAHEFYEEVIHKSTSKRHMRKLEKNIIPQGEVSLPHPRLHVDFPIVICEAPVR